MSSPTLVVMAAGIGSRYGGIKQIEPLGPSGEILLDYAVYDAIRAGFEDVVFIIRDEIEDAFRQRVEPTIARHCQVQYALQHHDAIPLGTTVPAERLKPWGTAHAVLACKDQITSSFGVVNSDDYYGRDAFKLLYDYLVDYKAAPRSLKMALVGYTLENTLTDHGHVSRGVCRVSSDGTLQEINERKQIQHFETSVRYSTPDGQWHDVDPNAVVSMNMWGLPKAMMDVLDDQLAKFFSEHANDLTTAEFLLPEVVGHLVREGRGTVHVLPTTACWFGVTYPEDKPYVKAAIRRLIDSGIYPDDLWAQPSI